MAKPHRYRINIIFEDDAIFIVNKPAGVLSIPDRYNDSLLNVYHYLQQKMPTGKVYIVHRLDRDTSGVMVFAKTEAAHRHLSKQFGERSVEKVYHAIVEGQLPIKEGEIDLPIAANPSKRGQMLVHQKFGKPAQTLYKVIEEFNNYTYLKLRPRTGRTHQIRVHLSHIGFPLAIDHQYGRATGFYLSSIKRKYKRAKGITEERPTMSRLTLHAYDLRFKHPVSEAWVSYHAPLYKDFAVVLKQLRRYNNNAL